jgi:hypothetical protein
MVRDVLENRTLQCQTASMGAFGYTRYARHHGTGFKWVTGAAGPEEVNITISGQVG